jgi:hypothetical protein
MKAKAPRAGDLGGAKKKVFKRGAGGLKLIRIWRMKKTFSTGRHQQNFPSII